MFAEILILGIVLSGVYSLLAIGFTLIYGVARVLNLAHGAYYMLTAYLVYMFISNFGINITLTIILALATVTLLGVFIYLLLIRPLQGPEYLPMVIITFAVALLLAEAVKIIFGPEYKNIPNIVPGSGVLLGVTVPNQLLLTLVCSISLIIIVYNFLRFSKVGKAMHAVAQDEIAARLMGINPVKMYMISMMIATPLAGIAAILHAPITIIEPMMGWRLLLKAFSIVILGGLGSIKGSILAAFILGFTEIIVVLGFHASFLRDLIAITVLLAVIIIKPSGLFGVRV